MLSIHRISFVLPLVLVAAGCAHKPESVTTRNHQPTIAVMGAPRSDRPQPPTMTAPRPIIAESPEPGVPFVIQPKYRKIALRGYFDEKGRAFQPQEIVQEVSAGGLNPEALDNWDRAYIPAENIDLPVGMGSPRMAIAAKIVSPEADALIENPEDVQILSLLRHDEDEAMADSMAKQTHRRKHWDSTLGWVLLKK